MKTRKVKLPSPQYPLNRHCTKRLLAWLETAELYRIGEAAKYNAAGNDGLKRITAYNNSRKAHYLIEDICRVLVARDYDEYEIRHRLALIEEDVKS